MLSSPQRRRRTSWCRSGPRSAKGYPAPQGQPPHTQLPRIRAPRPAPGKVTLRLTTTAPDAYRLPQVDIIPAPKRNAPTPETSRVTRIEALLPRVLRPARGSTAEPGSEAKQRCAAKAYQPAGPAGKRTGRKSRPDRPHRPARHSLNVTQTPSPPPRQLRRRGTLAPSPAESLAGRPPCRAPCRNTPAQDRERPGHSSGTREMSR